MRRNLLDLAIKHNFRAESAPTGTTSAKVGPLRSRAKLACALFRFRMATLALEQARDEYAREEGSDAIDAEIGATVERVLRAVDRCRGRIKS